MACVCKFDSSPDSIVMRQSSENKMHNYTVQINIFMNSARAIGKTTQKEKENSKKM